ncbi:tumor necrosis factor receptor superfamily member 6 [Leuresthes tenuis]|uniref:tumor necrosis factor receptor superfamily member 6 n=1 Tax=Leuresthes tenuis TaxID=355514 RepID=UPI003B50F007
MVVYTVTAKMEANFKQSLWFILFVLFVTNASWAISQSEVRNRTVSVKETARNRRQTCVDGEYQHGNRNCCLCGAGERLVDHCTTTPGDRKCVPCEDGTYNSHPNKRDTCEPCTSCSHPNANLEVAEPCTRAADAKCRCKEGHYCSGDAENCKLCHPCKTCDPAGIKQACNATSNTVCSDESPTSEVGKIIGIVVGVLVSVAAAAAAAVVVLLWKKRKQGKKHEVNRGNGSGLDVEMQPLTAPNVELEPHLPDIIETLGWPVMRDIAMRSGITNVFIENCQLSHPGNVQEQTMQLLREWMEKQGKGASQKLIQMLESSGKRAKAEKVIEILSVNSSGQS